MDFTLYKGFWQLKDPASQNVKSHFSSLYIKTSNCEHKTFPLQLLMVNKMMSNINIVSLWLISHITNNHLHQNLPPFINFLFFKMFFIIRCFAILIWLFCEKQASLFLSKIIYENTGPITFIGQSGEVKLIALIGLFLEAIREDKYFRR